MCGYSGGHVTAGTNVTGAVVRKDVTSGGGYGQCAVESSIGALGVYGVTSVDDVIDSAMDGRDRRKVVDMDSSERSLSTKRRFAEEFIYESNTTGYRHHHHHHSLNYMHQT